MRVKLTDHVLDRYVERVKPMLNRRQAKLEITALLDLADEPVPEVDFHHPELNPDVGSFDCYVVLSDGIALGCQVSDKDLVAVTLFVPGNVNLRSRRQARRQKRRRSQARKRQEQILRRTGKSRKPTDGVGWPE